jgi:hypothetical protein
MEPARKIGNEEDKFLHNLATPLGTALLILDAFIEEVEARKASEAPEDAKRLKDIYQALERMSVLLRERKEYLVLKGQ